jgi:hypothetical protein
VIFIVVLLRERDPRVLISHPHVERRATCTDGEDAIPELTGQIERLSERLRLRQAQCVLGHLSLDARAYLAGGTEVPIRRRQALKALMRALEVVVLDKQRHAPLAVLEVGKHRAAEQLLPQRLPEPLDLAAGLRMVRSALHMRDAVTFELGFELGRATPGGVLPSLIGEDLPRRAVVRNAARERLEHQHTSLVMRHRQAHQVTGVIIQERGHIDPLVSAQQEREQVRLPQLVRLGTLEVLHRLLATHALRRRLGLDAFGSQHPAYRGLGSTDA